jgi:hypothetical protein
MLKIEIQRENEAVTIKLEGRVTGPAIAKLNEAWTELAALLPCTLIFVDMRNVTHADGRGVTTLRQIQSQTGTRLISNSPLTKYVAESIARHCIARAAKKAA